MHLTLSFFKTCRVLFSVKLYPSSISLDNKNIFNIKYTYSKYYKASID